jgi:hypothetical protein
MTSVTQPPILVRVGVGLPCARRLLFRGAAAPGDLFDLDTVENGNRRRGKEDSELRRHPSGDSGISARNSRTLQSNGSKAIGQVRVSIQRRVLVSGPPRLR